jgi:hypothetical protein
MRLTHVLGGTLAALTGFVLVDAAITHRARIEARRIVSVDSSHHAGDATVTVTVPSVSPVDADSLRRILTLQTLHAREAGTFIGDILAIADSTLQRWPERHATPLRVWIATYGPNGPMESAYLQAVREAVTTWEATELPVRFTFVSDSATADITIGWTREFDTDHILGRTKVVRNARYWIVRAEVTLALQRRNNAGALDPVVMRALALHEVGHALGLDHSADSAAIMAARVRARVLSSADKATAQLLYDVQPGVMRAQ